MKNLIICFAFGFFMLAASESSFGQDKNKQTKESPTKERTIKERVSERVSKSNYGGSKGVEVRVFSKGKASINTRFEKSSIPSKPNVKGRSGYGTGVMFSRKF